jgi:hypothetical protein
MTNQSKLLVILVTLVLLRFALVPLLDYQADTKAQLELVTQQLDKAEQLIQSKEQLQQAKQASGQQFNLLQDIFYREENSAQFRLNQQQSMQQQLQDFQIEVSFFDWLGQNEMENAQIEVHQARVILEGNMADLMRAYTEVIAAKTAVKVTEFELKKQQGRRSKNQPAAAPKGSLTLMLEYSRLVKVPL